MGTTVAYRAGARHDIWAAVRCDSGDNVLWVLAPRRHPHAQDEGYHPASVGTRCVGNPPTPIQRAKGHGFAPGRWKLVRSCVCIPPSVVQEEHARLPRVQFRSIPIPVATKCILFGTKHVGNAGLFCTTPGPLRRSYGRVFFCTTPVRAGSSAIRHPTSSGNRTSQVKRLHVESRALRDRTGLYGSNADWSRRCDSML